MPRSFFEAIEGDGPVVAAAIHSGHGLRPEVAALSALDGAARRREEDPYTETLARVADTWMAVNRSRFEVDLNRPREQAVYKEPADAWGLQVWRVPPSPELCDRSLQEYDAFYQAARALLERKAKKHGVFLVLDLHSYNHRRNGPDGPPAPLAENPEVNVGTGSLDRARWGSVADEFMARLREYPFPGRRLDVRENVKFRGGRFSTWINTTFPAQGCALAIEFKKIFMDEWTGAVDQDTLEELRRALEYALAGLDSFFGPQRKSA